MLFLCPFGVLTVSKDLAVVMERGGYVGVIEPLPLSLFELQKNAMEKTAGR